MAVTLASPACGRSFLQRTNKHSWLTRTAWGNTRWLRNNGGRAAAAGRQRRPPHLNRTLAGRPGPPMAQGTGLRVWLVSSTGLPPLTTG